MLCSGIYFSDGIILTLNSRHNFFLLEIEIEIPACHGSKVSDSIRILYENLHDEISKSVSYSRVFEVVIGILISLYEIYVGVCWQF